ncbi:GGDEF domain-containing protein [Chelatococcus asaccharovorans]|uniref:diguanylate cyclase n=1 Tax=Chelatococcus asaccharovorans TaxID=28210 RepID=A0A2V3U328_9HYPH|nr:GGDEF domain-containing protein [Chelatococcus asaccharovorans]MBS7702414.1 GGDEF domain-containing protein [Chelatococcus asaccharovorans]PXW56384.1 diguanylate cyclase (GGDEF)-like protein [Chelatococcus asaccharovorans]CAH1670246.1 Diguanylate cyclase (GGDEF)-like protein [Chelatococcus asaccharovorans]CAH1678287.1 Diguanylate cyclase (GGDEF)-like protein [Chelatococcus asaccharovorans]
MTDTAAKLFQLYENAPVLIALYDAFDRLRYANRSFRAAFFLDPDEAPLWSQLMRRNFHAQRGTVIRQDDFEAWLISTQSRRGKTGFRAFETDLWDGRWLWMTETVQGDGWMLCIASDITDLRAGERLLRQDRDFAIKAAYTDELTGIANRRFATARIEDMLRRPDPDTGLYGCVAVLDLDNFKYINDRYGHQAGDIILRDLAARIIGRVRRSDCFGRFGGEEFVLVMPATSVEEAALIVERMLAIVRLSRPLPAWSDFSYSFSAGVAAGRAGDTPTDLFGRADKALYAAKMAGRNRIHVDIDLSDHAAAS